MIETPSTDEFKVVAIISAHNEVDIIAHVIGHLIHEGVGVYLLDHGSTDGTARAAGPFLGRGLIAIEPFPDERFPAARDQFAWADILTRKSELATELEADWFLHQDADEFRESPWEGLSLRDAIRRVDRFGYNAIDFELFDFWPTDNSFRSGDDPRAVLRYYERGRTWNKRQVKCWKRQSEPTDLVSSGGHEALFPDRRVFPLRFILRHYAIRSDEHGTRKVFAERRPRFAPEEVDRGWHVQYADVQEGHSFVRSPDALVEYDGDAARLALVLGHRGVDDVQASLDASTTERDQLRIDARALCDDVSRLRAESAANRAALTERDQQLRDQSVRIDSLVAGQRRLDERVAVLGDQLAARVAEVSLLAENVEQARTLVATRERELRVLDDQLAAETQERNTLIGRLLADIDVQRREIEALYASKSWRWTTLLRAVHRIVRRLT
jgi:hypothetical protein